MAKRTEKVFAEAVACCVECGAEDPGGRAYAWARKHALNTGHVPTVIVAWDIHPVGRAPRAEGDAP